MRHYSLPLSIAIFLLALLVVASGAVFGEPLTKSTGRTPLRPWKPTLTATISATSIRLGESVTVVYSTVNATGVMRDITQFRPFIGRCDGTLIPLQGSYTHTPAEVGTFHTNILAARRLLQLNGNGLPDGYRRAVILEFEVEVLPAEAKP